MAKEKTFAHNRIFKEEDIIELFEGKKKQLLDNAKKWDKTQFVGKDGTERQVTPVLPFMLKGFYTYVYEETGHLIEHYFTNKDGLYDDCVSICTHIKNYRDETMGTGGLTGHYNANLTARLTDAVDRQAIDNNISLGKGFESEYTED